MAKLAKIFLGLTIAALVAGGTLSFLMFQELESAQGDLSLARTELVEAQEFEDSAWELYDEAQSSVDYYYALYFASPWYLGSYYLSLFNDAVDTRDSASTLVAVAQVGLADAEDVFADAESEEASANSFFQISLLASAAVIAVLLILTIVFSVRGRRIVLEGTPGEPSLKAADGSWICPECGTQNDSGLFCIECGASLKDHEEKISNPEVFASSENQEAEAEAETKSDEPTTNTSKEA